MINVLLVFALFPGALLQTLDLCITNQRAKKCSSNAFYDKYKNTDLVTVNTDQISVKNADTNRKVSVLRIPGNYVLTFGSLFVHQSLDYMASDLQIELVPKNFKTGINVSPNCDAQSRTANMDGGKYCRYCDLCEVSTQVESDLKVKTILSQSADFKCGHWKKGREYAFTRTLSLPNTNAFQEEYAGQIDAAVQDELLKGEGTIIARMRLLTQTGVSDSHNATWKDCFLKNCVNNRQRKGSLDECRADCELNGANNLASQLTPKCQAATGYMPEYKLAACYDVEFDFKAIKKNDNTGLSKCRTSSASSNSQNPCRGNARGCCGSPHLMKQLGCSFDCAHQPRSKCNQRRG